MPCMRVERLQLLARFVCLLLCLCVLMQMLGVPISLWSPADMADVYGASILEGYAVPPLLPESSQPQRGVPLREQDDASRVPLLDHSLFHPPVLAS